MTGNDYIGSNELNNKVKKRIECFHSYYEFIRRNKMAAIIFKIAECTLLLFDFIEIELIAC